MRAKGGAASQIKAVPITVPMPHGSSPRSVYCKKVHCSWHRSCRTVWLNFGNQYIAKKVCDNFNSGVYRVLDQQVTSSAPGGNPPRGGYRRHNNFLAWTLTLTYVPAVASEADVTKHIPITIRPRHVELSKKAYEVGISGANATIRSELAKVGLLELWEDATGLGGKRAKAKARFANEDDARRAVDTLNGTPLPFNKKGKLTLQLVYSARVKISDRIYCAVQDRIEVQKEGWSREHLVFIPYDAVGGFRVIKLEGEDTGSVARAKVTLEKILDGKVATHEGKGLWNSSFRGNGALYGSIKELEASQGIVIIRNKRRNRLQMYGPAEKVKDAERLLAKIIQSGSRKGKAIALDREQFRWACQGGFRSISSAIGDGSVMFDVISNPKRILVTGSDDQYQTAVQMLTERQQAQEEETKDSDDCCTICWTETEHPVRTSCDHIYCTACFQDFCFSGATGESDLCVRCEGDSSTCKLVMPLTELQEKLPSSVFEDLLEASFKCYVRKRPQHFSYCPTPNCSQIYRISPASDPSTFTCPSCLVAICTRCQAPHPGMTCADHKDIISGGYDAFKLAKETLGIKDCPNCKTPIEKTYGCNHITCGSCQTHICWFCMATFGKADLCYSHMMRKHGF